MSIDNILAQATADAVKALYGAEVAAESIVPSTTKKEFEGNLTLVVFPFLKISKKKPEDTAQEIGQYLQDNCSAVAASGAPNGSCLRTVQFRSGAMPLLWRNPKRAAAFSSVP